MDKEAALSAAARLREQGHALTLIPAEGILGAERTAIVTTAKRRDIASIKEMLFFSDPNVVITVQAAQQVKGATMADTIKKF